MSTITVCAACGGMRAPAGVPVKGRRCTCSAVSSISVNTGKSAAASDSAGNGATATATGLKLCSVCGMDVTVKKRMKDSATGRYWCYECYVAEQRKNNSGMTMRCPNCQKDYAPTKMVKHGEVYWCESCDAEQGKGKKKRGDEKSAVGKSSAAAASEKSSNPGSKKLIIVFAVIVLAAGAYWYFRWAH